MNVAVDDFGKVFVGNQYGFLLRAGLGAAVEAIAGASRGPGYVDANGNDARFGGYEYFGGFLGYFPIGPQSVALDQHGNLFVSDPGNGSIRRINGAQDVTTVATNIWSPATVAADNSGSLFFSEPNAVSVITPSGEISVIAGRRDEPGNLDGAGTDARFGLGAFGPYAPVGIGALAIHRSGDVFVFDSGNSALRRLTRSDGGWIVSTITNLFEAGGQPLGKTFFASALAGDKLGNLFAIHGYAVRKIELINGDWIVGTVAGSVDAPGFEDGPSHLARFGQYRGSTLRGLAVSETGDLFIADGANAAIRRISTNELVTTLVWGDTPRFEPNGIAVDPKGDIYFSENTFQRIMKASRLPALNVSLPERTPPAKSVIRVSGPAGHSAVLHSSLDLVSWMPISTNDPMQETFSIEVVGKSGFYRILYR